MKKIEIHFIFSKIDVFIGALSENTIIHEYLKGSNAYYQDSLSWCVRAKHLIPKENSIFYVCHDWRVYLTMSLSTIAVLITIYVIQQFDDIHPKWDWHRITILLFANTAGFPYTYRPKNLASRLYYGCGLLGGMLFLIVFGVHYHLFMTNLMHEKQVDSIDEIIAEDYDLAGDSMALKYLHEQNEVWTLSI